MTSQIEKQLMENNRKLPFFSGNNLDQAIQAMSKIEYSDIIARPQEIKFEGDELFIGKTDKFKITTPFLNHILDRTKLRKGTMEVLGAEKFFDDLNFIFRERKFQNFAIRSINGFAYATYEPKGLSLNPINNKMFLNSVAEHVAPDIPSENWDCSLYQGKLKMLAVHPTKNFGIEGDIQREGVEFINDDYKKMMYQYHLHLLRTACTNSTVFTSEPFAISRNASDGGVQGFQRFLQESMRSFNSKRDFESVYKYMKDTDIDDITFNEIYKKVNYISNRHVQSILFEYLIPNLVTGKHDINREVVSKLKLWDLFNSLTHNCKRYDEDIKHKVQSIAGQLVIDLMKNNKKQIIALTR